MAALAQKSRRTAELIPTFAFIFLTQMRRENACLKPAGAFSLEKSVVWGSVVFVLKAKVDKTKRPITAMLTSIPGL